MIVALSGLSLTSSAYHDVELKELMIANEIKRSLLRDFKFWCLSMYVSLSRVLQTLCVFAITTVLERSIVLF